MKRYKPYQKFLVCILPVFIAVLVYFSAVFVINYITFPPCLLYKLGGIYCPSCGFTRAVEALVNGDILLAIRQNVFAIISIVCGILFYIELFVNIVLEKKIKLFVHSLKFLYVMLILLGIYTVLRNIVPILAPI